MRHPLLQLALDLSDELLASPVDVILGVEEGAAQQLGSCSEVERFRVAIRFNRKERIEHKIEIVALSVVSDELLNGPNSFKFGHPLVEMRALSADGIQADSTCS